MKVLVIDDDQGIQDVISIAFELNWPDASLSIAYDGESGLLMLESENPHLVILDIGLPGIDGFDVLKATRSVSSVPIIMLTVRDNQSDIAKALDMGADDYVTKPFSPLLLLTRAQTVLRRRLADAPTPSPWSSADA